MKSIITYSSTVGLAILALGGCATSPAQDAPTLPDVLAQAEAALTGAPPSALAPASALALRIQRVDADGQRFDPGQTYRIGDPPLPIQAFHYRRTRDLGGARVRTTWQRAAGYPGLVPFTYDEVVGPTAGYFTAPHNFQELLSGVARHAMPSATVDATQRNRELDEPQVLIAEALAHPERVVGFAIRSLNGRRAYELSLARPFAPTKLALDAATFLPVQTARLEDDAVLGDAEVTVAFGQWTPAGRARVPGQLTRSINGQVIQREQRGAYQVSAEPDTGEFDVPPALQIPYDPAAAKIGDQHPELFDRGNSFAFLQGEPVTHVVLTELAPAIYHVTGGTHHSLAIGTDHGVVIVEAPNDEDRSVAVQAAVARVFPGKPIRYVINTHHHHDHVGGLRSYVARGVPVVAPATDVGFLTSVFATPHTVRPDALARAPRPASVVGVGANGWTYTDGRTIQAILISSAHVEQQLVVYVPDARLVFEADLYFPTFFPIDQPTPGPFGQTTRALYQALVLDRGLTVDTVAGGHAGVANGTVFRINAGF